MGSLFLLLTKHNAAPGMALNALSLVRNYLTRALIVNRIYIGKIPSKLYPVRVVLYMLLESGYVSNFQFPDRKKVENYQPHFNLMYALIRLRYLNVIYIIFCLLLYFFLLRQKNLN
jgi:hypothetical protein